MPRLVVVGAGIAGLAAARRVREMRPDVELALIEASERAGGLVRSECVDGFVIDRGPESILTEKPAGMRTIESLGLGPRLVRTEAGRRGAFVVSRGRLAPIPEGFSLLAPTALGPWMRSDIVSLPGKLRALLDLVIPASNLDDESLGSFVRRRLGSEVLDRLAQPLVGGIYGAHPDVLGLAASMPRFLEAERKHGSVIRGLRARAAGERVSGPAHGARYGLFVNFDRGMQTLTDAMADSVADALRLRASVDSLRLRSGGFEFEIGGKKELADGVVVAAAAKRSARLLSDIDAELAREIESVRHGSGAIITFALPREQIAHPLDAYGYVSPSVEGRRVTASTFLSRKWPGRAPEGYELLRFFVGRDGDDEVADLPDADLVRIASDEAREMLGVRGEPSLVRVDRWRGSMPRFDVHHLDLVARIEARTSAIAGLGLAGNAYRGVGIPDSIASGERAADAALASPRFAPPA